jgi:hypothetical protein
VAAAEELLTEAQPNHRSVQQLRVHLQLESVEELVALVGEAVGVAQFRIQTLVMVLPA